MIYTDNGAYRGNRTRYFRDGPNGGVEWMYAVDYASGFDRWFGFGMQHGCTVSNLIQDGMTLDPITPSQYTEPRQAHPPQEY